MSVKDAFFWRVEPLRGYTCFAVYNDVHSRNNLIHNSVIRYDYNNSYIMIYYNITCIHMYSIGLEETDYHAVEHKLAWRNMS
jgi:hypothetical protein